MTWRVSAPLSRSGHHAIGTAKYMSASTAKAQKPFSALCAISAVNSAAIYEPKNNNAGLVDPACCLTTFGTRLGLRVPEDLFKFPWIPAGRHRDARSAQRYITNANLSNSCCRIGIEHPAPSTRKAASNAACGDTP